MNAEAAKVCERSPMAVLSAGVVWMVCALTGAAEVCAASDVPIPQDSRRTLGLVSQGYLSNRESFTNFRCEFTQIRGMCKSVDDALAGQWAKQQLRLTYRWLVKDDQVLFVEDCPDELVEPIIRRERTRIASERGERARTIAVPCSDNAQMWKGTLRLSHGDALRIVNMFTEGSHGAPIQDTPFDFGVLGPDEQSTPGALLRNVIDQKGKQSGWGARFEGEETVRGTRCWAVAVDSATHRNAYRFWVDPARGFLPVKITGLTFEGQPLHETYVTDVAACSNGRWFPKRVVVVWHVHPTGPLRVTEIKVTKLDVDTLVPDSDFYVDLTTGTSVSATQPYALMTLQENERVHASEMPALLQRAVDNAVRVYGPRFTAHPQRNVLRWAILIGTLVAVTGVFVWLRR